MISGIVKEVKEQGIGAESGIAYSRLILETKEGELISVIAFKSDALKLSAYSLGDEIKVCGHRKRGEDQFVASYTEKITRTFNKAFDITDEEYEKKRKWILERTPLTKEEEEIEKIMDFFGPGNVTKELMSLGISFTKREKKGYEAYKNWKDNKLKEIEEKKKQEWF